MILNYRVLLYNTTHNYSAPPVETYDQGGSSKTEHRPLLQAAKKLQQLSTNLLIIKSLKWPQNAIIYTQILSFLYTSKENSSSPPIQSSQIKSFSYALSSNLQPDRPHRCTMHVAHLGTGVGIHSVRDIGLAPFRGRKRVASRYKSTAAVAAGSKAADSVLVHSTRSLLFASNTFVIFSICGHTTRMHSIIIIIVIIIIIIIIIKLHSIVFDVSIKVKTYFHYAVNVNSTHTANNEMAYSLSVESTSEEVFKAFQKSAVSNTWPMCSGDWPFRNVNL